MSILITVEIGNGRTETLKVTSKTDLKVLAKRFCSKHNLSSDHEMSLLEKMQKNANIKSLSSHKQEAQNDSSLSTNFTNPEKSPNRSFAVNKNFPNAGVKIYQKGLRYLEIIANKIEKFKKMKEENENKILTFSPEINKSRCRSSVESLLRYGIKTAEKIDKMRGEKLNNEIIQCSFSPTISRRSLMIANRNRSLTPKGNLKEKLESTMKSTSVSGANLVFDHLFEDAKLLKYRRDRLASEFIRNTYSFKPDTSATRKIDQKVLENRGKYKRISDSRKEIEKYLNLRAQKTDLVTGQELFKPRISDYSLKSRRSYSPCNHNRKHPPSQPLTSNRSLKIVERIKFLKLKSIFKKLSQDNVNITQNTIKDCSISYKLRKILSPLIHNINSKDLSLDFSYFYTEMEELMKTVTPEERNYIMKGEIQEPNKMKSKTVKLKQQKFGIYERNLNKTKAKIEKLEILRKLSETQELEQCTFSPVTKKFCHFKPYAELWAFESESKFSYGSIN